MDDVFGVGHDFSSGGCGNDDTMEVSYPEYEP